jgi:L-arabinose isomerase
MINLKQYEFWFLTGSQHLYGDETLRQVADDSKKIVEALNTDKQMPLSCARVSYGPSLTARTQPRRPL